MRGVATLIVALIVLLLLAALISAVLIPLFRLADRGPRTGPSWRDTAAAAARKVRDRRRDRQARDRERTAQWQPVSRQSDTDRSWWIGIELVAADGTVLKRSHHTTLPETATRDDVLDVDSAALLWAVRLNEQRSAHHGGARR